MENTINYQTATLADFEKAIDQYGWVVYENALEESFVDDINKWLVDAYYVRRQVQIDNGIAPNMSGTLHHLLDRDGLGLKFLEQMYLDKEMKDFLGGNYIVNAFGGVMNSKGEGSYVQNIHRDIRTHMGDVKLMVQMLVLLDDFTEENGATYLLSGSHKEDQKPEEGFFYANAHRALGKKGSIILFDSNLWHAAGVNQTDMPRRALTISFTRPFMKQQLDYPRFLGYEYGEILSEDMRQVLGYKSRVPANLHEYYQPVEKRMYQRDQG